MPYNALKYIFPKKGKKMKRNVKYGNKWQKIANNCKISEITKCGEQMTKIVNKLSKIAKNVKEMPKTGQNREKL